MNGLGGRRMINSRLPEPAWRAIFWRPDLYAASLGEFAVVATVKPVDDQPDREPREEAQPGEDGQSGHQQDAEKYAEHRGGDPAGCAKATMPSWVAIPQNNHPHRN